MSKENTRRKIHPDIECVPIGFANGQAQKNPLTEEEKEYMISQASHHYGRFLDALKCDWKNDPNSMETPRRVAKAYVNDLWKGRYDSLSDVTSFPSDGYRGIVLEKDIPVVSQCSHHHQTILGKAHIAYIPGKDGRVIGLSKLNRIVDWFARRPQVQENLTMQIHKHIDEVCLGNKGVGVMVSADHMCACVRGVKHDSTMKTARMSGAFLDQNDLTRQEFYDFVRDLKR